MAILKPDELDIISHSAEQTQRLGVRLGALLQPGDVICLSGDMGAGKTMFASGIGKGWGTTTPVTSPTFALVHQYPRKKDHYILYHLDFYRLHGAGEIDSLGFDDILESGGPLVCEWPERVEEVLPKERLWIDLKVLEGTRRNFVLEAYGQRYMDLIVKFRELTFGV